METEQQHPRVEQSVADQFDASFRIDERPVGGTELDSNMPTGSGRFVVQNRTPYLIRIAHPERQRFGELMIPPFGERVMVAARLKPFESVLRLHRQRHEISVKPFEEPATLRLGSPSVLVTALLIVAGTAVFDLVVHGTLVRLEFAAALALVAAALIAVFAFARRRKPAITTGPHDADSDDRADVLAAMVSNGQETTNRTFHILVLVVIVVIGAVLPVIAIVAATDARTFLVFEGGLRIKHESVSRFTSRVVQMVYVSLLSLFPALLYFQFDRHRVGTIWGQWVRSIFRMDGRLRTLSGLNSRYGDELAEASNDSSKAMRFIGGNHSPIVVATILITLGWTLLVLQTESFDFSAVSNVGKQAQVADEASARAEAAAADVENADSDAERESAFAATEGALQAAEEASAQAEEIAAESRGDAASPNATLPPVDEVTDVAERANENARRASSAAETARAARDDVLSTSYFQLLTPEPSAAAVAFLGAYFYAVYLVLRSYFRGDLRPKIYNQISARLVTVVVVAYLINVLLFGTDNQSLLIAFAFIAGVIPQTAVHRIIGFASRAAGKMMAEETAHGRSLTKIDGIDLYDAGLLEAVGVHDVSALANSDLVSLMIATRIPAERLVDWADQAALMVALDSDDEPCDSDLSSGLRGSCIRTASDLRAVCHCDDHDDVPAPVDGLPVDRSSAGREHSDWSAVCRAAQRRPVWNRVHTWRTSPLARCTEWIPLPELPPIEPPGR